MAKKRGVRDSGYSLRWQEKQRENGKCWKCGKPANGFKLCKKHRKMDLARKKKVKVST